MQQDSFNIGHRIGRLEVKMAALEAELATWRHNLVRVANLAVRVGILAGLWLGVIGAGLSRDELAALLAAAIKKALSIG